MKEKWTPDRINELESLERLLTDVSSLNSRNQFVSNVTECIHRAKSLETTDVFKPRQSFIAFLRTLAADAVCDRK